MIDLYKYENELYDKGLNDIEAIRKWIIMNMKEI